MDEKYIDFAVRKAEELINIDSPTGFTDKAAEYVKKEFEKLGPLHYKGRRNCGFGW